jgi:hypothetical protein
MAPLLSASVMAAEEEVEVVAGEEAEAVAAEVEVPQRKVVVAAVVPEWAEVDRAAVDLQYKAAVVAAAPWTAVAVAVAASSVARKVGAETMEPEHTEAATVRTVG